MILQELTLPKVQQILDDLYRIVRPLESGNIDLKGRRIVNAGQAIAAFDYVRKFDLDEVQRAFVAPAASGALSTVTAVRVGAFATRGSAIGHAHTLFVANDLDYIGWVSTGAVWRYAFGVRTVVQSAIASFVAAAVLGANDVGCLVDVTDFAHTLKWSGTAWAFKPGDSGSGYIQGFAVAPDGGTWGLCDGTAYTYLLTDGTTASFTTPDYTTAAYLKLGTSATVGPTASGGLTASVSGGTPAGTNSAPTFTGDSNTTGAPSATVTVVSAGAVDVGDGTHTHDVTPTGTVSAPTFTGSALAGHDHGPNTLELRRTQLTGYFRR